MSIKLPRALERILAEPTWPGTLPRVLEKKNLGVDYDTAWARSPGATAVRKTYQNYVSAPLTNLVARPTTYGEEHLSPIVGPAIFTANHTSHLDTAIVLGALPTRFRDKTVVAAAADYFFDRPWKAVLSSLALGAIPVERSRVNRQSADIAAELLEAGWSLVIFPEGGRSTDGWGQEFRGGAAYLAKRCSVPVVPIHLRGVRPIFPKGSGRIRPGSVEIRFGVPLTPRAAEQEGGRDEDSRRFAERIERAVATLGDEAESDWWSARRRFFDGETPAFRGPLASSWRRSWELPDSAQKSVRRSRSEKKFPW
ncbi:MAG TPA: lysophospholipid acyltransferase family protein [Acidimicrobiales bacterium]